MLGLAYHGLGHRSARNSFFLSFDIHARIGLAYLDLGRRSLLFLDMEVYLSLCMNLFLLCYRLAWLWLRDIRWSVSHHCTFWLPELFIFPSFVYRLPFLLLLWFLYVLFLSLFLFFWLFLYLFCLLTLTCLMALGLFFLCLLGLCLYCCIFDQNGWIWLVKILFLALVSSRLQSWSDAFSLLGQVWERVLVTGNDFAAEPLKEIINIKPLLL